ncbi:MAG TPA: acyltransferase [Ramlibacter sp.]|jgi:peptidoglycan/LPS O-acetylase OafA/YrhL
MRSENFRYLPEIDHLRLLAALLVFGFHYCHYFYGNWQPLPQAALLGPLIEGHTGVSLFFVLSGFIFMSIADANPAINYRRFIRNRVLRIAPLFLVVFIVAISVGRDRFEAIDLLYVFVTNLGDAPTSWHFITGPAWSISVEFTFYLVFPFLASFVKREGALYLVKLMALMMIIKLGAFIASDGSRHMLYSTLVGRFDQFLIGMVGALVYAGQRTKLEQHGRWILPIAALLTYGAICIQARWFSLQAPDHGHSFWLLWPSVEAALWGSVLLGYLGARLELPVWLNQVLSRGGEMSFSLYMWHALVIVAVFSLTGPASSPALLALLSIPVLAALLVVGWLSFTCIERPFLQMRYSYVSAVDLTTRSAPP